MANLWSTDRPGLAADLSGRGGAMSPSNPLEPLRRAVQAGELTRREAVQRALAAGISLIAASQAFASGNSSTQVRSTRTSAAQKLRVDYIIVGSGTAGCVLAHRLSANPQVRVLVLEAGSWPSDPAIDSPQAWPALQGGAFDWNYRTVPQSGLDGRVLPCPRGKGFGGSSLLNALGHQRGAGAGYDRWEALGATGWNQSTMRAAHRRSETYSGGSDRWRGGEGPLDVLAVDPARANPVARGFLDAALGRGFRWSADLNGEQAAEACWNQFTIDGTGRRAHGARTFLEPALHRDNLQVLADAPVESLLIERGRCRGVRYRHQQTLTEVRAERGVIMATGAIDTPKLLMLSGLGPAAHLRDNGIMVVADLPEVGANLQDHPLVGGVAFEAPRAVPLSQYNHGEGMLFTTVNGGPVPDVLVMSVTVPFVLPTVGTPPGNCFTLVPALLQPRSRGRLRLDPTNPRGAPLIDPATFADPADLETLTTAVEIAREIGARKELGDWALREVFPGPQASTRTALREFVKRGTSPFYHPVGTVRMGRDAAAPVTPELRVRGVEGLWVADASV
ncbi:MAG: FAD-binding protein, partial [Sinobacteraceae bacterium]|nr:FAD-binding protein [Nevskiaceae bacterium]